MSATNVENALKRAQELIDVGQKAQAMRDLSDLIERERRHFRKMWVKTHEDAMLLFIRLSCELRDNSYIKYTLTAYRVLAQVSAPASLALVIKEMLDLSEERVGRALAQCGKTAKSVEELDLDQETSATNITLEQRDRLQRSEQAVLIPWLKFTWENLRNVLDILRNNASLEQLYHGTAHRAFKFCEVYGRKVEFRRLCELLRTHLAMQSKFTPTAAVEGEAAPSSFRLAPEAMELHLATRFEQLRVATALHLWVEAFKSIEDISQIISLGTRKPSAQLMATYYSKLAVMFLASGSFLFHALALRSYYDLNRERNKSLNKEQIEYMASSCVLAALCIPLLNLETQVLDKEKNRRMSLLCGFEFNPDRESLLKQLGASRTVLQDCHAEVRDLFFALESSTGAGIEFDPQTLVQRLAPKIRWVRSDAKLEAYAQGLESLVLIRLVAQLSRVFSTLRLDQFHAYVCELSSLSGSALTPLQAEVLLVRAIRHRQLSPVMRIDHGLKLIRFVEPALEQRATKQALRTLALGLDDLLHGGFAKPAAVAAVAEADEAALEEIIAREAKALEERKQVIAQRKQEVMNLALYKEKLRVEREEHARAERIEMEHARVQQLALEEARRKQERAELERLQIQIELDLKMHGIDPKTVRETENLGEFITAQERDRLVREKQEKQEQVALEAEKRVQQRIKRFDALVRAQRDAERPKLARMEEERLAREREEEAAAAVQRLEEERVLLEQRLQAKRELDAMFTPEIVQEFLQAMRPSMEQSFAQAKQMQRDVVLARKMEEKVQRALARSAEAAKQRKQALEDNREQQRLEEDARKREAKLRQ